MQYKGYNVSSTEQVLLYGILQELCQIKAILTPREADVLVEVSAPAPETADVDVLAPVTPEAPVEVSAPPAQTIETVFAVPVTPTVADVLGDIDLDEVLAGLEVSAEPQKAAKKKKKAG